MGNRCTPPWTSLRRVRVLAAGIVLGAVPTSALHGQAGNTGSCDWTLTVHSPIGVVHQGDQATFVDMAGATMFSFGSSSSTADEVGMFMVTGITGPGGYDVGPGMGGTGSGAFFTVQPQTGPRLPIASGSGEPIKYQGRVVAHYPPPARLMINHFSSNEIRGQLSGTFFEATALASRPPRVVLVPIDLVFSARSGMAGNPCP